MFPCVRVTSRCLDVALWLRLFIAGHEEASHNGVPSIVTWGGIIINTFKLDASLHYYVIKLCEDGFRFPLEIKQSKTSQNVFGLSIYQASFGN